MSERPKVMRAVQLIGHGGPENLVYREDVLVPSPGACDVLIRVGAAGVNNTDLNTRLAWYSKSDANQNDASWSGDPIHFPRIQGADVCGQVIAIGESVEPSLLNSRVIIEPCIREANGAVLKQPWYLGSECDGGFAEFAIVASRHAYPVRSTLSDIELASFPCSYSTAENMLCRARVVSGDTVLVTGASGGVGSAAVQLAKARGATVVAITSLAKAEAMVKIGADRTISREASLIEELGPNSVDVVIDLVAGENWAQLLEVLRTFGRYAVAGAIGGPNVNLDVRNLYLKDLELHGCTVLNEGVFNSLVGRIESEEIKPLVADTFPLNELAEAQEQFSRRIHIGKIVIEVAA